MVCFFFFQAEDGIRDIGVTGVQTCALPIWDLIILSEERAIATAYLLGGDEDLREGVAEAQERGVRVVLTEIGRASCRERVEISGVAVSFKKKPENILPGQCPRIHRYRHYLY